MAYWLYKSEPGVWSWSQQVAAGDAGEPWTGVRNRQAQRNMQAMKRGDRGFFYHSNTGREIVGIVEVVEEFQPDPTDDTGTFGLVVLKAVEPLARPVTLADIKATPELSGMTLVRQSRLSVQPVSEAEWRVVCRLGGIRA
ncbi:MAG: EVE domain-containing protein [Methylobacteriaceae bacterium]|nr:EVE domain-containing protein [Methylobacteriaceae bacterium]